MSLHCQHPGFQITFIVLFTVAICSPAIGQIKTPFTLRYQTSIQGNLTLIGNNVLSTTPTGNYNGNLGNHSLVTVFVDIDADTTTFNSSNATLELPGGLVCPVVKKVFLYWSAADFEDPGNEPDWNFNQVKLRLPGDTTYNVITADQVIFQGRAEHFDNDPYTCFKDITALVPEGPNGTYWIANVKAKKGTLTGHSGGNTGTSGGWIIVVVYESTTLPQKNIAIFDGYVHVAIAMNPNPLPVTFSGFQTVPAGDVNVDFLMGSLEGDWDLTGDYCQIQQVDGTWLTMSSILRQPNNFFHSIIGREGLQFLNRTPASQNTLGFDADKFPIPNPGNSVIGNNQTSATIRMGTNQETYGLFLLGLVVDVWYPNILALFNIPAMNGGTGGTINAGDTVTFSVQSQNLGNDAAAGLTQSTLLPPGLDFLNVIQPIPTGVTYSYNSISRVLQFSIPDELVEVGDPPFTMQYAVKAITDCILLQDSAIQNPTCQLTSVYHGAVNPSAQSSLSSTGLTPCNIGNLAPVNLSIFPPPSYPVAVNDSATTMEDKQISIPILANDIDCDNNININSIWVISSPLHGTFTTLYNSGLIIYTPALNYYGPDSLRYRICDFDGLCDTAWVLIHVIPVNDPPAVANEYASLCENGTISGNLLINDADTVENTPLTVLLPPISGPSHGNFLLTADGSYTYSPDPGYSGNDMVVVTVCDSGFPMPAQCHYDTLFITITAFIQALAGNDQRLCLESMATLTGNTPFPGTGNWLQISGPDTAIIVPQGTSMAIANGLIGGNYAFQYTVTTGSCISSDTMIVSNELLPGSANAGSDQLLCMDGLDSTSTNLAANMPEVGTSRWRQLQGPSQAIFADTTSPVTFVTNLIQGIYLFIWTVSNGICPVSNDTVMIMINSAAIVQAGTNHNICEKDIFENTDATASNYREIAWTSSGTGTFNDPGLIRPRYIPGTTDISSGHVYLILTAQSNDPCSATIDSLLLTFSPGPIAATPPPGTTCDMIPLEIKGASVQNSDSLFWSHSGKGTLTGAGTMNPVYTPAPGETGIVTFILTAFGYGSCSSLQSSDDMTVTIYSRVKAEAGDDQSVASGSTTFLEGTASAGSGSYSFWWEPFSLFEDNTDESPTTKILIKDTTIYLTVRDMLSGCEATDSLRIFILEKPVHPEEACIRIYNVITPNADGLNDQWVIDCIENFPVNKVTLMNRWGDKINEFENYNNTSQVWKGTNVHGDPVPDGSYFYIVAIKDGGSYSGWIYVRAGNN